MNNIYIGKKGISETVSFVLITLLIVFASITSYTYSKSMIEDKVLEHDSKNMERDMKLFLEQINKHKNFDKSSFS